MHSLLLELWGSEPRHVHVICTHAPHYTQQVHHCTCKQACSNEHAAPVRMHCTARSKCITAPAGKRVQMNRQHLVN
eukprot:2991710-Lingulodinium_polyedra.AAC.1